MRFATVPAIWVVSLLPLALSVSGCATSPSTPAKATSLLQEGLAEQPAQGASSEVPVPNEIKEQLLSASEITEDSRLEAKTLGDSADGKRLLIGGYGPDLCSPTGNCPYWIFRKTVARYEQEVDIGSAQDVSVDGREGTLPDVVARQHGSAYESGLRLYQFDGTRYRLTKCMDQTYRDPDDIDRSLDEPIITEMPCNE